MAEDRYLSTAIIRAAQVLELFTFEKPAYTNTEFARKLGLNKSSVMRILYSLERAGFLQRDKKTGEYRLTHKLYRIGSVYIQGINLHSEAMPILAELASSFGETVHLAVLSDFEVFYLDKIESSLSIGMMSRIASKSPAYCTGVGKAILANLEEQDLEAFFHNVKLIRYTPNTITNLEELRLHLKKIREQGFAIDDSEHEPEVKCVAAPLLNKDGKVLASISVAGPVFRMTRERMYNELVPSVKEAARRITSRMGYFETNSVSAIYGMLEKRVSMPKD